MLGVEFTLIRMNSHSYKNYRENQFLFQSLFQGWFVNSSTDEQFDASPSNQYRGIHHELVDLLQTISPGFKKVRLTS